MNEEQDILRQWITLKENDGIKTASSMTRRLFGFGIVLFVILVTLIYVDGHSILIAIVSIAIGWLIAERNALLYRIVLWPKLDKYLNWKIIRENLL